MKKNWSIILLVIGLILCIGFYIKYANFNKPSDNEELFKKISELELKIDSMNIQKDSIIRIIDSTHVKIITNEKHYQERVTTIINQPISADSQFISDYIGRYIESHKSYFQ